MDDDCILDMPRGPGPSGSHTPIAVRGCDLFEFRGDKVYRKDSYWKIVEGA